VKQVHLCQVSLQDQACPTKEHFEVKKPFNIMIEVPKVFGKDSFLMIGQFKLWTGAGRISKFLHKTSEPFFRLTKLPINDQSSILS